MRDIKFRVYDEGSMKYPEEYKENRFDNYFIDLNGQLRYYQNCYDGGFFDTDNAKLMQFTGLHDKNGKEIYEGDIVKVKNVDYHIGQIIYDEEYAEYEIEIGKDSAFPISVLYTLSYDLDIEVIGNIYENSELLKGADNVE